MQKPPSFFLGLGFPYCSVFGDCWYEMTAVTYLEALVASGDTWSPLTAEGVREAMQRVERPRERGALASILRDSDRISAVAGKLTGEDAARGFSPVWGKEA